MVCNPLATEWLAREHCSSRLPSLRSRKILIEGGLHASLPRLLAPQQLRGRWGCGFTSIILLML